MPETLVYTARQMKEKYGPFYDCGALTKLDRKLIPQDLWPLIPYAGFWGIEDDRAREILVRSAPKEVKRNLKAVVTANETILFEWLAGEESYNSNPTQEFCAFSAMLMAADSVLPMDLT